MSVVKSEYRNLWYF